MRMKELFKVIWVYGLVAAGAALVWAQAPLMTAEGFAVPQAGKTFSFPRDHGSHPEFKLEWWYVTGHLYAEPTGGRRLGFQATFFRQAAPDKSMQLHLAHMAIIDVATGKFLPPRAAESLGLGRRLGGGYARCAAGELVAAAERSCGRGRRGADRIARGVQAEAALALTLMPAKPLVVLGENGVSRKGAAPTAASYYSRFHGCEQRAKLHSARRNSRCRARLGWITRSAAVSLIRTRVGWDWVSVQFTDQRELMMYRLRTRDGGADPASSLTWVDAAGKPVKQKFSWEVLETWKSPATGAVYPSRVALATTDPATGAAVRYTLEPLARDQELPGRLGGIAYWEGACRVRDAAGKEVGSASWSSRATRRS